MPLEEMKLEDVTKRVLAIEDLYREAHVAEDALFRDILRAIGEEVAENPASMAYEAMLIEHISPFSKGLFSGYMVPD